jgi:hypothetical protein
MFFDIDKNAQEFNDFLKEHNYHDIHHIAFHENFIDVIYLNEVIYPRKGSTGSFLEDIKDGTSQIGKSQPSLL